MGESVKKFGVDGKKRFSVRHPDGTIQRFGTCNPDEDERFDINHWNGLYFLVQYQQHDIDYSQPEKQRALLPKGSLIANGFYDHEHDEFVTPEQFLNQ